MKKKFVILLIVIYILGVITTPIIRNVTKDVLQSKVIYKVRIKVEHINLREEVDLTSKIIREVYKNEVFDVVKYYEGNIYNWYNIIYEDGKTGWIASDKDDAWVRVINK